MFIALHSFTMHVCRGSLLGNDRGISDSDVWGCGVLEGRKVSITRKMLLTVSLQARLKSKSSRSERQEPKNVRISPSKLSDGTKTFGDRAKRQSG